MGGRIYGTAHERVLVKDKPRRDKLTGESLSMFHSFLLTLLPSFSALPHESDVDITPHEV